MKLENLPDFAKPYKTRGFDIRLRSGNYYLYKITSKNVEGKNYPVLQQEFIGIINPDGTLRDKKKIIGSDTEYEEFGLSDFIVKKLYRRISKSIFDYSKDFYYPIIQLAIVKYIFGSISDLMLSSCHLTSHQIDELKDIRDKTASKRIDKIVATIEKLETELLGEDKSDFESIMKLCVIAKENNAAPNYPKAAYELLQKHGVKCE